MKNVYNKQAHKELFADVCKERNCKVSPKSFDELFKEHLIKSWFALLESTGGGAIADLDSIHIQERCLAHIECVIHEIDKNLNK